MKYFVTIYRQAPLMTIEELKQQDELEREYIEAVDEMGAIREAKRRFDLRRPPMLQKENELKPGDNILFRAVRLPDDFVFPF